MYLLVREEGERGARGSGYGRVLVTERNGRGRKVNWGARRVGGGVWGRGVLPLP